MDKAEMKVVPVEQNQNEVTTEKAKKVGPFRRFGRWIGGGIRKIRESPAAELIVVGTSVVFTGVGMAVGSILSARAFRNDGEEVYEEPEAIEGEFEEDQTEETNEEE